MARRAAAAAAAVALAAAAAFPQKAPEAVCPYCKNDPKILAAAGLVGHGAMPFGKTTADDVRKFLSYAGPIFLETQHFRIMSTLEGFTVPDKDFKKIEAELADLKKKLPLVNVKTRQIDPWLRLHLYGDRCEKRYARFLDLIKMKDSDFGPRELGKPYHGEGKYLGMMEKYELVLLKDIRQFKDLLRDQSGSTTSQTKREHFAERGALSVFIPAIDDLRNDDNLYAHVSHNLGHNFVLGYRYYSYEPPKWFEEGFAHFFEKEVSEEFNSFDSEEAAVGQMYEGKDWRDGTLRFLGRGKATSTADLIHKKGLADIGKEDHVIAWSKVEFLIKNYPDKFPKFLDAVRGRLDAKGLPDGTNIPAHQRDFFKNDMGMTLSDFDREWEKWVTKTYPPK
jgi:hypothetical protein